MVSLDLNENLFGLCLSFLDIRDYNWMLNLPRPEAAVVLCAQWKKESQHERMVVYDEIVDKFYGWRYRVKTEEWTMWYHDGLLHKTNGPALMYNKVPGSRPHPYLHPGFISGPAQWWYRDGRFHNDNGPAFESSSQKEWWIDGKRHRIDGPAFINNYKLEWWIDGKIVKSRNI